MPQTCSICRHMNHDEIDESLLTGETYRNIAKRYGTSTTALFRHKQDHIPVALAQTVQASSETSAETLFDRLRAINDDTRAILHEAREAKSGSLALAAINRIERQIELEAKILGQLDESVKVAVGFAVKPPESDYDLTLLSLEELDELVMLLNKATPPKAMELGPAEAHWVE